MVLLGLELTPVLELDVAVDHANFPKQMLGKSLIFNAVKDVRAAVGIFGKPLSEVPNGASALAQIDKLFGFQPSVAGRLLAQQRYETFTLMSGESIDQLAIRFHRVVSELGIQLKSVPSIEIQIGKLLVLFQNHPDATIRTRILQFMRESDSVTNLASVNELFDHLRNAEFQGKVFGGNDRHVTQANSLRDDSSAYSSKGTMQRKSPKQKGDTAGPPSPCRNCDGNHWNSECPHRANNNQQSNKGAATSTSSSSAVPAGSAAGKKKLKFKCHNCGNRGHFARDCESKSKKNLKDSKGVFHIGGANYGIKDGPNQDEVRAKIEADMQAVLTAYGCSKLNAVRVKGNAEEKASAGHSQQPQHQVVIQPCISDLAPVFQQAILGVSANVARRDSSPASPPDILFDSGAQVDCTGRRDLFSREPTLGGPVLRTALGHSAETESHGYVNQLIEDLNYVPGLKESLKALGPLDRQGDIIVGGGGRMRIYRSGHLIGAALLGDDNLYHYNLEDPLLASKGPDLVKVTSSADNRRLIVNAPLHRESPAAHIVREVQSRMASPAAHIIRKIQNRMQLSQQNTSTLFVSIS